MSVKDTKEGDPVPRWNLGGLAGPSELWTCKRLRLEQLILKRDRQVRILKVSPKNSELELALNFVPCASKSFYEASAFFSEICFLCIEYRNTDYKVDDHHHPAHCNELKEFDPPKKSTSMLVLHPCMALQAQRCPLQLWHLAPCKIEPTCHPLAWHLPSPEHDLVRKHCRIRLSKASFSTGPTLYAVNSSACYLSLDLEEFRLSLWLLTTAKQSTRSS